MSRMLASVSFVLAGCVAVTTSAAPLYGSYSYYDGFATDDAASWVRQAFNTGSITHNAVSENFSYSYTSGSSNPSGYFVGQDNASVENTLEVGEKIAFAFDIPTSSYQGGTYAAAYLSDVSNDGSSAQGTWLMLGGTSFSGTRGWHVLESGSWVLKQEVASAGSNPFWIEYVRPDASTLIGTVYGDAAMTDELFTYSFAGAESLSDSLYLGVRLSSRPLNATWDDVTIAAIPEPGSLALLGAGLLMLARRRDRD